MLEFSSFFEFTRSDFDYIVKECMLDEDYQKLLEYKIKGYSIVEISMKLNLSERAVNRRIKKLKEKILRVL